MIVEELTKKKKKKIRRSPLNFKILKYSVTTTSTSVYTFYKR